MLRKTLNPTVAFLVVCFLFVAHQLAAFRFLLPLAHALVLHGAAVGAGALLLTFVAPQFKRRAALLVFGWALGLGAFGCVMFAAAHLNAFGPSVALFLLITGMGAWLPLVRMGAVDLRFVGAGLREPWAVVSLAVVGLLIIGCMTPPLFWDANVYHVALPMQYLMWGGAQLSPHFSFSANPLLGELALSPILILSFDPLHMNVAHGVTLLLLLAMTGLTAKRFVSANHWPVAGVGLLSMPVVVFVGSALKSDLFTAIYLCGVLYVLFDMMARESNREASQLLVLLGLFAGMGAATRYHGLVYTGLLGVSALMHPSLRTHLLTKKAATVLAVTAGGLGALFLIQNALVFSNPVYPFLDSFLGTGVHTQRFAETQATEKFFTGFDLEALVMLPANLIYNVVDGDRNELLAFYPVLALFLWLPVFKHNRSLRLLGVNLLLAFPFWFLTSPRPRYFPLLWLFFALAGTAGFSAIKETAVRRWANGLLVGALLVGLSWNLQADEKLLNRRADYIFGHEDEGTYLTKNYGPYAAFKYINDNLASDAVVLLVGDNRAAYLERRALVSGVYVTPLHEALLAQSSSSEGLKRSFREAGATHVLISLPGLERLKDFGWGKWSDAEQQRWEEALRTLGRPLYTSQGWLLFSL